MRAETADLFDDAPGGLIDRRDPERVRELVRWLAGHAGVAIAEKLDVAHAEDPACISQLRLADLAKPRPGRLLGHVRVDDRRQLAVGATDDAGLDAAVAEQRERSAHRDGLVVAVRMHGHEPQAGCCHHSSVTLTDRITSFWRIAPTTSIPFTT